MAKQPVDPASPDFKRSKSGTGTPISADNMALMSQRPGLIQSVKDTWNVWMGPGLPPPAQAPVGELGRVFDYIAGLNRFRTPEALKQQDTKDTGGTSFQQLRALGGQTVISGAIYHAAEKAKKIEYTATVLPKAGETPEQTQLRGDSDPRITELRTFFESPDKDRDWPEWISDAWVQILTCDNLSILRWDYEYGSDRAPYAINIIDGDHIQPMIDDSGRIPIDPDVKCYTQWTRGVPRKSFSRKELLYRMCWPSAQRVMGNSPIERMWLYLNIAFRRDMTKLDWYTQGNIPAGIWPVSTKTWGAEDIAKAQDLMDLVTSGRNTKSKLLLVPAGEGNPVFPAEKSLLDPFDDFLTRLACYYIGVPHTALIHEQNRATSTNSKDNADEEGELPRTDFTRRLLNRLTRDWFGYSDIVWMPQRDEEIDAGKQSEIDDRGIKNGSRQIDEVRKGNGDVPLGLPPGHLLADGSFISFEAEMAATEKAASEPTQPPPSPPNGQGGDNTAQPDAIVEDTKKTAGPFDFASVQVNITGPVAKSILGMAALIPDDALAEKGREDQPHVTAKFGVDPAVTIEEIRAAVGKDVTGTMAFGVTAFFPTEKYDVVFVTVDSPDLVVLNEALTSGVDTTQTQDNYVPHATIAYVESGRGHEFAGIGTLVGVEYQYTAIYFSDTEGNLTKLQAVRGHVRAKAVA